VTDISQRKVRTVRMLEYVESWRRTDIQLHAARIYLTTWTAVWKTRSAQGLCICLRVARTRYSVFTELTNSGRSAALSHLGAFECSTPT
jgi:hypothetical protein